MCMYNINRPAYLLVGGTVDYASLGGGSSEYYWWARRQLDIGYLRLMPSETEMKTSSCSQFLHKVYYPQSDTKGGQADQGDYLPYTL